MSPKHMFRNDYGKGIGSTKTLFIIVFGDFKMIFIIPSG